MRFCSSDENALSFRPAKLAAVALIAVLFFAGSARAQNSNQASQRLRALRLSISQQTLLAAAPDPTGAKIPEQIPPGAITIRLMVAAGVPLRAILTKPLRIKKPGEPVRAVLAEDVYAFDRVVLPKGTMIDGHIAAISPPHTAKRIEAYLNADLSPHGDVRVIFDTLTLKNGAKIPIHARVLPGLGPTIMLTANSARSGDANEKRGRISSAWHEAFSQAKPSAVWQRAKSFVSSEWPYHSQKFASGTTWDLELEQALPFGTATISSKELAKMGELPESNTEVYARLAQSLSSATAQKGMSVEAILTRPVFSSTHELLLPVGTQLHGVIVKARPARHWHRNGELHFTLSKVQLPEGTAKRAEMALAGMDVSRASGIQLDDEGEPHVASNKTSRALRTAISIGVANATMSEDRDGGVVDPAGHNANRALGGGSGYKIVGLVLTTALKSQAFSEGMGFFGAGKSFYAHFVARGQDLVLPQDTPMRISFGPPPLHRPESSRDGG